jgi:hypothetical protein
MASIPITRNERAAFASAPSASSAAAGTCPIRSPADQVRATVVLAYVPSRQGWRLEDAADGADGIFGSSVYPDDPVSNPAFATERNLDAQYPQERLRAAGSARRRQLARFLGPKYKGDQAHDYLCAKAPASDRMLSSASSECPVAPPLWSHAARLIDTSTLRPSALKAASS